MHKKSLHRCLLLSALLALGAASCILKRPASPATPAPPDNAADLAYLRQIQRDTWAYIDHFIAPETGYPHDNNRRTGKTNTTNLGLYLASLSMACRLGYVDEPYAIARIEKILDSLDRTGNWHRLYNNWLDPSGESFDALPGPNNISDYNKLPAGLIVVRQTFPQLAERCTAFLDEIPWDVFYDPETGRMHYEFDVVAQSVDHPVYFFRGEDKILGHFLAIASGKVPPDSWDRHDLSTEERHGMRYYRHGWQGGGLFMQFICGLFLDDRGTSLGQSATAFAWAQILHARQIGAPVWGWSACAGPDDAYHGWNDIRDEIVTPHASALAIHLFPREVIDNLRRLEDYGLREPYVENGRSFAFGFRDAVNWKTGAVNGPGTSQYLVLDQAMLFLSLVNYTENGLLWSTFNRDPLVQNGKALISEFSNLADSRPWPRPAPAAL
ncbi:MAG: hypothetical protein GX548_07470 [Lentisphaerae bacterium]|nr:hypothetical protein [Lentisphaerota bacterium]